MKKFISVLLVMIFMSFSVFDTFAEDNIISFYKEDDIFENYSYDTSSVIAVIKHKYSAMGKVFTTDDFDKNLIASVEDIFCASVDNTSLSGYNMDEYCQILKLHLIEHTESNVKNAIIQLKDNPIIEEITPNYISYSSPIEKNTIETEDGGSICYRNRSIIIIDKPKFNNWTVEKLYFV